MIGKQCYFFQMNARAPADAMRPHPFQSHMLDRTLVNEVGTPTFLPEYWSGQSRTNRTSCTGPGPAVQDSFPPRGKRDCPTLCCSIEYMHIIILKLDLSVRLCVTYMYERQLTGNKKSFLSRHHWTWDITTHSPLARQVMAPSTTKVGCF
jgi:hypothetical protein